MPEVPEFTAIHRAVGSEPSPLTDELLDAAVQEQLAESDELDWKSALPPEKALAQSDIVKDIAAMANSGGGLIVFGVTEEQGRATGRIDGGDVTESYERTLRRVAVSGIQPPVFGLRVHRLPGPPRALCLVVPGSAEAPHLIYRGDYFGAPVRNHADTEWMRERQLESLYRARLNARDAAATTLRDLYDDVAADHDATERAWMVGVARPRYDSRPATRVTREEARDLFSSAEKFIVQFAPTTSVHPWESVDRLNPRPGLRRWVGRNAATAEPARWKEAWSTVHDDGSVTLAAAVGGGPSRDRHLPGSCIDSSRAETFVADLMGLVAASHEHRPQDAFEVLIGVEWAGEEPILIQTVDQLGFPYTEGSIPITRFRPVAMTVRADLKKELMQDQVRELASDVVNQGGIQFLRLIYDSEG